MNPKAIVSTLIIFTVLQLAMVLAGHWVPFVKVNLFAPLGTVISLVGAIWYVRAARPAWTWAVVGGAIVGGVSALIGILISYGLGDVPVETLFIGTGASAVAGAVGGAVMRLFAKPAA